MLQCLQVRNVEVNRQVECAFLIAVGLVIGLS